MRRMAAHYICYKEIYRLHYLEIEDGLVYTVRPLEQEAAGIEFYNGLLFLLPDEIVPDSGEIRSWQEQYKTSFLPELIYHSGITGTLGKGNKLGVWHSSLLHLPTPEFSTDDCRSDGYIQRL